MRIAICHADVAYCSQLENMLVDVLRTKDVNLDIRICVSGESLCKEMERQHYDLIFLAVSLPGISGIQVSRFIREQLNNYIVKIAYIAGENVSAKELCQFVPIGYLSSNAETKEVERIVDRYFTVSQQVQQVFRYKKRLKEQAVPYCEVMYFESKAHQIIVYKVNGTDMFYGMIEDVYEQLKASDFLRIHQSFVVNYHFIRNYDGVQVKMADGRILPISRSKRKQTNEQYNRIQNKSK